MRRRRRPRIKCGACGGELAQPIPAACPQCGARIAGLRRRIWPRVLPWFLIAGMLTMLVAYVRWLSTR